MKKISVKIVFISLCASFMGYNVYQGVQSTGRLDSVLASTEALANDTEHEKGCAGQPTWVPDHYLGSSVCWNGGTHKKCKKMDDVCCDPIQQTDCKELIDIDIDIP